MRRFISFFLAALLLCVPFVSRAQDEIRMMNTIMGTNLLSQAEGEGFHDASGANEPEYASGGLVLRKDEWARYDISSLPDGKYLLSVETASAPSTDISAGMTNGAAFSVHLGDKLLCEEETVGETESLSVFRRTELGELVKNGETFLQITNVDSGRAILKTLSLQTVIAEESICYSQDEAGTQKASALENAKWISGTVVNYCLDSDGVRLFSAFYGTDGKLISVTTQDISAAKGKTVPIRLSLNIPAEAAEAKCFLWSSDGFKPVCGLKSVGESTHFYVSAQGSDAASGEESAPFQTLERAQRAVRECNGNMKGNIYVHLKGEFFVEQTLTFTEADSGSNGYDVFWKGDGAVIHGGRRVNGWSRVKDTPLYSTSVEAANGFRQLYVNENRGVRARSQWFYWPKEEYDVDTADGKIDGFVLNGEDFPLQFQRPADMEFVWLPSWKAIRMPAEKIDYSGDNPIVTFPQEEFHRAQLTEGDNQPKPSKDIPFYIENAPEFLDEPGEWYYNNDTQKLYYYPREGEDMASAVTVIPCTETLLKLCGTEQRKLCNLVFEGIRFQYGAWEEPTCKGFVTRQAEQLMVSSDDGNSVDWAHHVKLIPSQIQIDFAERVMFRGNEFSHLGSVALSVNQQSANCSLEGNLFDDISASAITLGDWTVKLYSPKEELCGRISVKNNVMRRCGVEYMTPVVTAYYVSDTCISHNDISDAPYTGISLGWGWGSNVICCRNNEISYNKINHVLYKLKDGGHVYTLGRMKNTSIHDNYFVKSGEWKGGIYLDNASAYLSCYNNVFEECMKWLKLTYGNIHDNAAWNNYSETGAVNAYPDANSVAEATGKTDGVWPEAAQSIIASAGLTEEYQSVLTNYNSRPGLINDNLNRLLYLAKPGVIKQAGDIIPGGEGEAYHDLVGNNSGIGITDSYDGTGHLYLMNTKQGEWTKYEIEVPEAGNYDVFLNLSVTGTTYKAGLEIDGKTVGRQAALTKTCDDYSIYEEQKIAAVSLTAGKHIFKLEHAVGNFALHSLRLVKEGTPPFVRNDGFITEIMDAVCKTER